MRISMDAPFKAAADDKLEVCPSGEKFFKCSAWSGCCDIDACKNSQGCPRRISSGKIATTVAAVAPPVAASPTPTKSTAKKPENHNTDTRLSASTEGVTTYFRSDPTGGGAWYTDSNALPSATIISLTSSAAITQAPTAVPSATAPATEQEGSGISGAAKGGIIGGVGGLILAIIVIWFTCGKQRRKLRSRISIDSLDKNGMNGSAEEDDCHAPPITTNPIQQQDRQATENNHPLSSEDIFLPFGGRYEEPQSRFNRVSELSSNSKMMNHPVSPESRESFAPPPAPAIIARSATAGPEVIARSATASPVITARSATASPEFISRLGTATPELHGPPEQAAIAELASPGLPRVVEIHSTRSGVKKYKPYRANAASLYPVAETTPSYLTGTLNATQEDRSSNKYVNSWKEWESTM